jgi:hypothetical protein
MMERRIYYLTLLLLCLTLQSRAAVTNWTGFGSGLFGGTDVNNWYNASNWSNGVPGLNDDAQIGVSGTYTNSPVLNASTTVKTLTIGVASSGSLTVNSGVTLAITGNFTFKYNNSSANFSLNQTVVGSAGGTITCNGSFNIGDTTPPATPNYFGSINITNTFTVTIAIKTINVGQNLVVNTTSASAVVAGHNSSDVNNPTVNFDNGQINVAGNFSMTNSAYVNTPGFTILAPHATAVNISKFLLNPATNTTGTNLAILSVGGNIDINADNNGAATLDVYGPGPGKSTFIYSGATAQTVYTAITGLDTSPYTYQNLGFSGAGVKTMQSGTINLAGDWSSAGGKIDALTNSTVISFRGTAQSLTDGGSNSGAGFTFGNVSFRGSGIKTISSGKFSVAGTGVLTMAGTATLAAGGNLTLLSTSTSSATVAPLPLNTAITGNVKVQRLIKGSPADLSKRGYRFISSAVYTAAPGGVKSYDLKYLLDSAYVSGMSGGGFNAPSTNPSLYLYREDVVPNSAGFTTGQYKGIAKINNTNAYDIGTQKRLTTGNVVDTTTNLPVGNGVLFFFRGNKSNNATQAGTKVVAPYDYPEDVAFTQTGQLNTGTINVKPWYNFDNSANPNNYLSYTNSPSLNNSVTRGFILVGNPYASTINWEKFNRNGANSSIYGGGFPAASVTQGKIWIYNPTTRQYDTYLQAPTISSVADTTTNINPTGSIQTGDASNMIASGQGFLIRATTTGQTLSFRESAKTNTQPTAANLIRVMSAPVALDAISFSSMPVNDTPVESLPILGFRIIKDSINTDDVVLAFNNRTNNNFTPADDAEDLNGNGALVSLSVISSDDVAASIKQLKLPENNEQVINLLADATTSGQYQLKLNKIKSLPAAYDVWLKDVFANDSLDIKANNTYDFNIDKNNAASYGRNRFKIVIRQNQALNMRALSFNAEKTALGARLSWQTENEEDDYIFCVLKSTDNGKTFKQIGLVSSNNISTYSFLDTDPAKGNNQYKVKIEHKLNSQVAYSAIASLNYAETSAASAINKVVVYPNPASDVVNIKMATNNANANKYTIKISNSSGLMIKELASSQPYLQENITGLTPGTYMIKVINITENKVHGETKFIKL